MKKVIFFFLVLPLYGCESVGRHFQQLSECNGFVDSKIPPKYVSVYVRTDTSCRSSGSINSTTLRGDQYTTSGSTNCTSTPVYQTVEENSFERNALRNECMSQKKSEYNSQKNIATYSTSRPSLPVKIEPAREDFKRATDFCKSKQNIKETNECINSFMKK